MGLRVTEGSQGTLGIFVSVWKEGGYKAPRKRDSKFRSFVHQLSHLLTPAGRLQQNPMAGTGVVKTKRGTPALRSSLMGWGMRGKT